MDSKTILMIEPEIPQGVSARKLIVETAKHNVITAYNGSDGLSLFRRFPNVDAVLVHSEVRNPACAEVLAAIRSMQPQVKVAILSPRGETCEGTDHVLDSYKPQQILAFLEDELGASSSI
jgi:response regulator RpfG family c-di-GMP phosphodiesterase